MIIKRGSTWTYSIDLPPETDEEGNKRRVRKWKGGFKTRKEAELALAKHRDGVPSGGWVEPSQVTVGEWLDRWLNSRRSKLAETTFIGYGYEVKRLKARFGTTKLQHLQPLTVEAFYDEMLEAGYSPKTIKNCAGVLSKACKDAVKKKILSGNPTEGADLPDYKRPEIETWTAGELKTFLAHAESHRLHAAFHLMVTSAMRRSELLGLRWRNVNLKDGHLAVVDTAVPLNSRPVLREGETKTKGSRRVISLDDRTVSILKAHKHRQNEEKMLAGPAYEDRGLVFADELGGITSPEWFTRLTKKLCIEAGVKPLSPHAARHTFASISLANGVPIKVLSARLGHSSVQITWDRYSHLLDGQDQAAADVFAEAIL